MPELAPLSDERRYVQPAASRAAVTYDLFAWAAKHNRGDRPDAKRVKVHARSLGPNGLQAPTSRDRDMERFKDYFEIGSAIRAKSSSGNWELNVHRNRAIFLICLMGLVLYSLYHAAN
jgi:hypothetical protein